MLRLRNVPARAGARDDGFVLVVVMGAVAVLSLFILGTLTYAVNTLPPSGRDVAGKKAEAAAQAGIDEYIARLNINDTYYTNNGVDSTNGAYSGWKPIQGTGTAGASYTYRLLTTTADTSASGIVRLKVTGQSTSGGQAVNRTLLASLQRKGFLSFLYTTDLEATDPALYRSSTYASKNNASACTYLPGSPPCLNDGRGNLYLWHPDPGKVDPICSQYYYAGRVGASYSSGTYTELHYTYDTGSGAVTGFSTNPLQASSSNIISGFCSEIQWTGGDVVNGPLHTNDAMQINGPALFSNRQTETGWADTAAPAPAANHRWWGSGTPSTSGYKPSYAAPIPLPDTNTTIRTVADPNQAGAVGCLYAGGTKITFSGTFMTVFSPQTTASNTPSRCLDVASNSNPQVKSIPPVIYIDNASTCGSITSVGYPSAGEDVATTRTTTRYDCHHGDAFISGSLSGRTTVATANDIVVTGDTTYAGGTTGADALGLVANNYVWVYHPVKSDGSNLLSTSAAVRHIDAAIFGVQHSFIVQNYDQGALLSSASDDSTKLTVRGVIVQKFRGPVGTSGSSGGTGYFKNYLYDSRLFYAPPPYFLQPTSAPWSVSKTSD